MRGRRQLMKVLVEPTETSESVTVALAASADDVFAFMWDPASSRVLDPSYEHAVTLPGTPAGVGEIQVYVSVQDGVRVASAIEVQSLVEGRRAVTRRLTEGPESVQVLDVQPVDEHSCLLTQEFRVVVPAGVHVDYVAVIREASREAADVLGARLVEHFGSPRP